MLLVCSPERGWATMLLLLLLLRLQFSLPPVDNRLSRIWTLPCSSFMKRSTNRIFSLWIWRLMSLGMSGISQSTMSLISITTFWQREIESLIIFFIYVFLFITGHKSEDEVSTVDLIVICNLTCWMAHHPTHWTFKTYWKWKEWTKKCAMQNPNTEAEVRYDLHFRTISLSKSFCLSMCIIIGASVSDGAFVLDSTRYMSATPAEQIGLVYVLTSTRSAAYQLCPSSGSLKPAHEYAGLLFLADARARHALSRH